MCVLMSTTEPTSGPLVHSGSFESIPVTLELRDIYLYWQETSPFFQNGPGFYYHVVVYEDGIIR